MKKGFSILEIILSLGVFLLVVLAVLSFYDTGVYKNVDVDLGTIDQLLPHAVSDYSYGEKVCYVRKFDTAIEIDTSEYISTSTKITGIFSIDFDHLIVTTDSASTTEADIFIFYKKQIDFSVNITLISSKDVGPGIRDARLIGDVLYILNSSVSSHVQSIQIKDLQISIISSIKIPELSVSYSLPKSLFITDRYLYVGSEKNSTGGELFILPLDIETGMLKNPVREIEIGGQVNAITSFGSYILIVSAGDPEFYMLDYMGTALYTYDAPLTLGNGKSVISMFPYVVLGRTVGSGELVLFKFFESVFTVLDVRRTHGTVDGFIKFNDVDFLALTSNQQKEFQVWSIEGNALSLKQNSDALDRIAKYSCNDRFMHIIGFSTNTIYIYENK